MFVLQSRPMAGDIKHFIRKQWDHCYAEEVIDEDGHPTMWALGGFVPEDATQDELTAFLARSPALKPMTKADQKRIDVWIKAENERRVALLTKMGQFLMALESNNCNIKKSCQVSGMWRGEAMALRVRVPNFAAKWDEIFEGVTDDLEEAGIKRAVQGVQEPVYQQGMKVGEKTVYSDGLLQHMLQGRRSTYKSKIAQEVSGPNGGPIQTTATNHNVNMTPDEFRAIAKEIASDI